ncbi:hypothetical protein ACJ51O_09365 [Burkholderia pyrrocinia]|uniref:hypothetical protein n=1 Tax=Burkholderia TaxID=32008 RepID=UPI00128BBAC3|nr:hypothetical protein [Burkholderia sp. BE17]MPV69264.1 hypothetical protein [Burkholderia sp. BE17]
MESRQTERRPGRRPDDVMARYRVAFGRGDGMWRDKSATFNAREGLGVLDVEAYLRLAGPR